MKKAALTHQIAMTVAPVLALAVARPALAQDAPASLPVQAQSIHGLQLDAPTPLEERPRAKAALDRAVADVPAIRAAEMYLWDDGTRGVSVGHYRLSPEAGFDLDKGIRGALDRGTRRIGGSPETGPDAYSIRQTTVSGFPAREGVKRVERGEGAAVLRSLATRADRDVWIVTVFGPEGPALRSLSDTVFGSLRVER